MSKELGFRDDEVLHGTCTLSSGEGEFTASLTLNPNRFPVLAPNKPRSLFDSLTVREGPKREIVSFDTTEGHYALLDVEEIGGEYLPATVVMGPRIKRKDQLAFASVHLAYGNLTKWVTGRSFTEFSEGEVRYKLNYRTFEEHPTVAGRELVIGLSYHAHWENENDQKRLVERVTVDCAPMEGHLTIEDCRNLERDFRLILTFLIGMPSTIEFMMAELDGESVHIAYPTVHSVHSLADDFHAIHWNRYLCENAKWTTILNSYYSKRERFGRLWSRVFAMMNYHDVWDYRVLGYVSILQNYLDQTKGQKGPQLPYQVRSALKKQARAWAAGVRTKLRQHDWYRPEWEAIFDEMNGVVGRYSFGIRYGYVERFEHLLSGVDGRLVEILAFSRDDFAYLKELRDSVGHASDLFEHQSFERLSQLEPKLVLFILCLVYQDLGMDVEDIITAYSRSFSQFVLAASVDKVALDRYSGRVQFIEVPIELVEAVRSLKAHGVVLERKAGSQEIRLNSANSRLLLDWYRSPGEFRNLRDHVREKLYAGRSGVEVMESCGAPAYLETMAAKEPMLVHSLVQVILADAEWNR